MHRPLIAIALGATLAHADAKPRYIQAISLQLPEESVTGFVLLNEKNTPAENHLSYIKASPAITVETEIFDVRELSEAPMYATYTDGRRIETAQIQSFSFRPHPLNGTQVHKLVKLPRGLLTALRRRKPLFHCVGHYSEITAEHWISFNPAIGKAQLQPLCDRTFENQPSKTERDKVLREKYVFHVQINGD